MSRLNVWSRIEAGEVLPSEWNALVQQDPIFTLPWVPTEHRSPQLYVSACNCNVWVLLHFPTYEAYFKHVPNHKKTYPKYSTIQIGTKPEVNSHGDAISVPVFEYRVQ